MKHRLSVFGFLLLTSVFLSGCSLLSRKKAALSVSASPQATIFLDGEHLGQSPFYDEKLKAGEYTLKIVPEAAGGQALTVWEGRVNLVAGILTVVNRELGLTHESSSGEILSFEPLADKNSVSIAVVTTPDGAVVNLDGEPRGFAPLSIDNLSEGDHILTISSPGYQERSIKAKTVKGHKLIASVQLAREPVETDSDEIEEATESAETKPPVQTSPQPTPAASPASPKPSPTTSDGELTWPYVEIASDIGWVNVRSEPSTAGGEDTILTKVDTGEKFPLVDTQSGWYQIEYETGKNGWISGKYAEKYE